MTKIIVSDKRNLNGDTDNRNNRMSVL